MAKRKVKSKALTRNLNQARAFHVRGIKDKLRQMAPFMLHPNERGDQPEDTCQKES